MSELYNNERDNTEAAESSSSGAAEYSYSYTAEPESDGADHRYSHYSSSGYPSPEPPKKNNHGGLKALAAVLCLAAAGGGAYQVYKYLNADMLQVEESEDTLIQQAPEKNVMQQTTENVTVPFEEETQTEAGDETMSLFSIAARRDAKYLPDIVDEIMPSVVGVSSTFEYTRTYNTWGWGGIKTETNTQNITGTGTGIIMTDDGYIVTNAHVVFDDSEYNCGEAVEVSVLFSDETEHDAKIIAYDSETDIAVLKVDENGLIPAEFGDSDDLRVGELVIAVGNPLGFELFGTVSSGIVSALNREISINEKDMTLIQTDAAINSGNSGGPLLNSCGQVIGINSAKMSSSYGSASVEGLGFAIPINNAKVIIDDLINYKHVTGRPQIGITSKDITEAYSRYLNVPMGVYVQSVAEDSAAEKAGIQIGDIIIGIDGEAITTAEELNKIKNQHKAGDEVTLTISRAGADIEIDLTLQDAAESTASVNDPFRIDSESDEN
ncbi:MAG: trypsin-like peptidase domain-containing protein [Ruminococcus sp.]|nr:trypsin-like peptidase domain-containing protein [Ruminococcus sp.]